MTSRWPPLAGLGDDSALDLLAMPTDATPTPAATPAPPIEIGTVVASKYRVERVIGFGGMGIVCAATHLELGTPIAIKFVRPERASDDRAAARFLTEARAAAQLQSQYACRVIDCGRLPTGSPYIVMEYLSGQDLRTRVDQNGPLAIEDAITLSLQACEALAEAHAKHIVHRDVKPENLFVAEGPGGAPLIKVLDFGISKQLSPLIAQRSLTDSTEAMGSPFHMSPEQMLDPGSVDSRTDIWAMGVVLYEVLTGQMPFHGETAPQLCANVMTTAPIPPQAHRAEIPDGLARLILRCLEKEKDRRFADVGELSQALKDFGGPGAALAAARVEQILGRVVETNPPPAIVEASHEHGPVSRSPVSIPGVPRRGLGMRVGVVLVLLVATGFAAVAVKHAMAPSIVAPPIAEVAASPSISAGPSQPLIAAVPAAPSASATPKRKPKVPSVRVGTPHVEAPHVEAPPVETPQGETPPTEPAPAPVVEPAPSPPEPVEPPVVGAPVAPSSTTVYPTIPRMPSLPSPE